MGQNNAWKSAMKYVPFLALMVVPIFSILAARERQWVGRLAAVGVFYAFLISGATWYSIHPEKLISRGAKLQMPRYQQMKKRVVLIMCSG